MEHLKCYHQVPFDILARVSAGRQHECCPELRYKVGRQGCDIRGLGKLSLLHRSFKAALHYARGFPEKGLYEAADFGIPHTQFNTGIGHKAAVWVVLCRNQFRDSLKESQDLW